jgi:hypothetical protein
MSVQDEFFFGGGHDEASIPYQGIKGAAVDPQVIGGQYSCAGRVQQARSAAGFGWNIGGRGNPPLFQRHAPSHVSVATHATIATSVVATRGFFGEFCWSMAEINAGWVICTKNAHGAHGSHDYSFTKRRVLRLSLMSLLVLSTFMPRIQKEKHADLQSKYAGNLAEIKIFKQHKDTWDV